MRLTFALIVCLVFSFTLAQENPTNVYVSTTGDDTSSCSEEEPCLTLQAAVNQLVFLNATSGNLSIAPGTYGGTGNFHIILPNIPMTVMNSDPSQSVIIDGSSETFEDHSRRGIFFVITDASFMDLNLVNSPNGIVNVLQDGLITTPFITVERLTFLNMSKAIDLLDCGLSLKDSAFTETNLFLEGKLGNVNLESNTFSYAYIHFSNAYSENVVSINSCIFEWSAFYQTGSFVVMISSQKFLNVDVTDCTFTHTNEPNPSYSAVNFIDKIPGNWYFLNSLFQTSESNPQNFVFYYRVNLTMDSVYYPPTEPNESHLVFNGIHQTETVHQELFTPLHSLSVLNSEAGVEVQTLGGDVFLTESILHNFLISVTKANNFIITNCTLDTVELQAKRTMKFEATDTLFFFSTIYSSLNLPTSTGKIERCVVHKRENFLYSDGGIWDIVTLETHNKETSDESFGPFMRFKHGFLGVAFANIENTFNRNGGGSAITAENMFSVSITDSIFHNCSSHSYGGAVWITGSPIRFNVSHVDISNVTFSQNSAINQVVPVSGGAIAVSVFNSVGFSDCLFNENESDHGGAIYVSQVPQLNIYNTNFGGNSASNNGGAIYIPSTTSSTVNMNIVDFVGNEAIDGAAISCCKGSICGSQVFTEAVTYEDNRNGISDGVDVNCPSNEVGSY